MDMLQEALQQLSELEEVAERYRKVLERIAAGHTKECDEKYLPLCCDWQGDIAKQALETK